jgi:hypothetical protein
MNAIPKRFMIQNVSNKNRFVATRSRDPEISFSLATSAGAGLEAGQWPEQIHPVPSSAPH